MFKKKGEKSTEEEKPVSLLPDTQQQTEANRRTQGALTTTAQQPERSSGVSTAADPTLQKEEQPNKKSNIETQENLSQQITKLIESINQDSTYIEFYSGLKIQQQRLAISQLPWEAPLIDATLNCHEELIKKNQTSLDLLQKIKTNLETGGSSFDPLTSEEEKMLQEISLEKKNFLAVNIIHISSWILGELQKNYSQLSEDKNTPNEGVGISATFVIKCVFTPSFMEATRSMEKDSFIGEEIMHEKLLPALISLSEEKLILIERSLEYLQQAIMLEETLPLISRAEYKEVINHLYGLCLHAGLANMNILEEIKKPSIDDETVQQYSSSEELLKKIAVLITTKDGSLSHIFQNVPMAKNFFELAMNKGLENSSSSNMARKILLDAANSHLEIANILFYHPDKANSKKISFLQQIGTLVPHLVRGLNLPNTSQSCVKPFLKMPTLLRKMAAICEDPKKSLNLKSLEETIYLSEVMVNNVIVHLHPNVQVLTFLSKAFPLYPKIASIYSNPTQKKKSGLFVELTTLFTSPLIRDMQRGSFNEQSIASALKAMTLYKELATIIDDPAQEYKSSLLRSAVHVTLSQKLAEIWNDPTQQNEELQIRSFPNIPTSIAEKMDHLKTTGPLSETILRDLNIVKDLYQEAAEHEADLTLSGMLNNQAVALLKAQPNNLFPHILILSKTNDGLEEERIITNPSSTDLEKYRKCATMIGIAISKYRSGDMSTSEKFNQEAMKQWYELVGLKQPVAPPQKPICFGYVLSPF